LTLLPHDLISAITARMDELREIGRVERETSASGRELIERLRGMDFDKFSKTLGNQFKGAVPVLEGNEEASEWSLLRPTGKEFRDFSEARKWAGERLGGVSVGAVDGSQIYPGGELSLPFGVINIGWYINHHNGDYELRHEARLLLPDELGYNPDSGVNLQREMEEIERLIEIMNRLKKGDVVFLDGSLVLSFVLHIFETERVQYLDSILRLLQHSEREEGPFLAGYVDSSRASDLAEMLSLLLPQSEGVRRTLPTDASLLRSALRWGERTSAFICARDNILQHYRRDGVDYSRGIAFFYIKSSAYGVSRVEFPTRYVSEGMVDCIADIVRAQVIVGEGYPYVLNRAHHEAVVSVKERERFMGLLQVISEREVLGVDASLKAVRKRD